MDAQRQFGDQVTFIGVASLTDDIGDIEGFVSNADAGGFAHIPDVDGVIWDQFGVNSQSTYVYINDDGTWERSGYGSLHADVQELIDR